MTADNPFARLAELLAVPEKQDGTVQSPAPATKAAPPVPRAWTIGDLDRYPDTRNRPDLGIRPQSRARPRPEFARSNCTVCDGVGSVFVMDGGYSTAHSCDCDRLDRFATAYNRMELPPEYALISSKTTDWSWPSVKPMRAKVERFILNWVPGSQGMVLCGPNGVGKGHLAALMCTAILARTRGPAAPVIRSVEWSSLIDRVKDGFGGGTAEEKVLAPYLDCDLLWLDELGKGQRTDWSDAVAERLVCRRMDAMKTIIVTTNLPPYASMVEGYAGTDLGDCIGERARSRLMGRCVPYLMQGADWRTSHG